MSSELDMSQYLDLFLQEADEQLEILEQETLKLEQEPSPDRLQVIFRAAHTLKGSSRAMGFLGFANITHEMENLLDQLRAGKLAVSTEIADALLACLDTLTEVKGNIADGKGDQIDCTELVKNLQAFTGATGGAPAATTAQSQATEAAAEPAQATAPTEATKDFPTKIDPETAGNLTIAAEEKPVYHAKFRLRPDCVMKFVRAFMAISAIQEKGELLATVPNQEALEEEQFESDFELFFQTEEDLAVLGTRLESVGELDWCSVAAWTAPAPVVAEEKQAEEPKATVAGAQTAAAPAEAKDAPAQTGTATRKADTGQTVRVDVARLDELMNLVGELVIDRTRVAQIGAVLSGKYEYDENVEALSETVGHIARITGDLQDQIMKARMLPIETVFNRFPRMVRDLAQKVGKDIKLELLGGDTELDRSVIEVIGDPLLHILRNSVDHGIEMPEDREAAGKPAGGRIVITAKHQENHIVIDIEDDGKGIDVSRVRKKAVEQGLISAEAAERITDKEAVQFIFASGLSTAQKVSEVSGRGVGMDIVRSNIQRLGGIIEVETEAGVGTKFSLRLPLTLAIIRGLLVTISDVVYVVPLGSVIETLLVPPKDIQTVHKHEVIVIRGLTTPLVRMREVFNTRGGRAAENMGPSYVVIVGLAEKRIGLVVDSLIGEQEVVIKSLSRFCGEIKGVSGATILGDGNVALIADVNGIIEQKRSAA